MYAHIPRLGERGTAGLLLVIGSLTLLFGMMLAEFTYPDYNVAENYISDLGANDVVPAILFNVSICAFGALAVYAGLLLRNSGDAKLGMLLVLAAIGAILVGVFNSGTISEIHYLGAIMAFLFGGIAVAMSARELVPTPLSCVFMVMAIISLASLVTMGYNMAVDGDYLGLGPGAVERLVAYPIIWWAPAFGSWLMVKHQTE